jgi:hypothetical protein
MPWLVHELRDTYAVSISGLTTWVRFPRSTI